MTIDFHTHCFPERIAERAMKKMAYESGCKPNSDGTLGELLHEMNAGKVDKAVVLSIATNAHQQHSVNDFASSINGGKIIAFGSVYPDAPDALCELDRIKSLGLKGVKFHPEYQGFYPDDEKMRPIYKKISQLGLVTVFHAGADYGYPPPYHATPVHMAKALSCFDTPVVAAHWGGIDCGEEVIKRLCGLPIYFDISFGYGCISKYCAATILEKHGTDKMLFGSDFPWHRPSWERYLLDTLSLTETEKEKIYFKNAEKLLRINE